MVARSIVLVLCVAAAVVAVVPAAKYPAGVDQHLCPNYPYCNNEVLAVGHHGVVAPYAAPSYATYGHHGAAVLGAGAKYPAGVSPHTCPNYPYCGPTPALGAYGLVGYGVHGLAGVPHGLSGAYTAPVYGYGLHATHHGAGARYPASVDPHSCPNYPYCQH